MFCSRLAASIISCLARAAYELSPRCFLRNSAFSASSPSRSSRRLIFLRCEFRTLSHPAYGVRDGHILIAIFAHFVRSPKYPCPTLFGREDLAKKVTIRIDLEGKLAENFLYLKERRGLKNNSELVRMLISEEYQRQAGSTGPGS